MKLRTRILALMLAAALTAALTGCGSTAEDVLDKLGVGEIAEDVLTDLGVDDIKDAFTPASPSGIRPEFKEMMDSYEEFFDEYIAFMKKYANSSDPTAMLEDYMAYMKKYKEVMEKLDAVDKSELSDEEALYYTEVSLRISKKLLDAAG